MPSINFLNVRRSKQSEDSEQGLSLLEVVVTTSIMMIITTLGILPFQSMIEDSRKEAEAIALEQTKSMVIKYALDGDEATDPIDAAGIYNQGAGKQYNAETDDYDIVTGVEVKIEQEGNEYTITATHAEGDGEGSKITVTV